LGVLLIIPAFEPSAVLIDVVTETLDIAKAQALELTTLIVNDGSSTACAEIFETLEKIDSVTVQTLQDNQGKGAALKAGFRYALEQNPVDVSCIVTADADGQHLPQDIVAVAARAHDTHGTILGVRKFDASVPLRSRFGNLLTRQLFRLIHGVDVADTQTGLRAIQRDDLPTITEISYNRYEYEIEMLTALVQGRELEQVPISTVYEPGNPTSHFNPIVDSARIYWVLLRYILTVLFVSFCEILVVAALTALDASILVTLLVARAVSVILFFGIARSMVFKSSGNAVRQVTYFLLLVMVNLVFLFAFVWFAETRLDVPRIVATIIGNTFFFSINFVVQRNFIFFDRIGSQTKGSDQ